MFGNDHINVKLGLQKLVFRAYPKEGGNKKIELEVEVVYVSDEFSRMTCIVIKVDDYYQDFYYNGNEECFKVLTDPAFKSSRSWELEEIGEPTPELIRQGNLSRDVLIKLGIIEE